VPIQNIFVQNWQKLLKPQDHEKHKENREGDFSKIIKWKNFCAS